MQISNMAHLSQNTIQPCKNSSSGNNNKSGNPSSQPQQNSVQVDFGKDKLHINLAKYEELRIKNAS